MNIGIDIDGVLIDLQSQCLNYGIKMCVDENLPINVDLTEYNEGKSFGWSDEQTEKFWNTYLIKYVMESPTRMYVPEIIEKLKSEGHNIIIITARDEYGMPKEYYGRMQELTKEWLVKNNIKYDKIIFGREKMQPCIENNIDVMIEDSPLNIKELSSKIKVIKFDCEYNRDVNNDNVITAYSWYHIYRIISELQTK